MPEIKIPMAPCGCGGRGILWERDNWQVHTVEAFCSKHCGINFDARPIRNSGTPKLVARKWNRALTGKVKYDG